MPVSDQPHSIDSADQWLAFRCVTGELTDEEVSHFESRLANDFVLQSALADAVKLTAGLSEIQPAKRQALSKQPLPPQRRTGRLTSFIIAASCLIGFGLLLTSSPEVQQPGDSFAAGEDEETASMIALWSALGEESSDREKSSGARRDSEKPDGGEQIEVPNWMLLAVLEESSDDAESGVPQGESL